VGFIRDLPHDLVAAFRATLEETREASLLLHVVDALAEDRQDKITQVNAVLDSIGAGDVPQILVYNKTDLLEPPGTARIERDAAGVATRVWVSARSGAGLAVLASAIAERAGDGRVQRRLRLPPGAGRLRARLFELGSVTGESLDSDGSSLLDVLIPPADLERLARHEGLEAGMIEPLLRATGT
jgi:GTP-binding protein HflX